MKQKLAEKATVKQEEKKQKSAAMEMNAASETTTGTVVKLEAICRLHASVTVIIADHV